MKRFIFLVALAGLIGASWASDAHSDTPFGLGRYRRVGRVEGYWFQPTRGPLFDYSPYFAARYPQLPGAAEFQWPQPQFSTIPGQVVIGPASAAPAAPATNPANPKPVGSETKPKN